MYFLSTKGFSVIRVLIGIGVGLPARTCFRTRRIWSGLILRLRGKMSICGYRAGNAMWDGARTRA
jgi:hypothetical protein